MSKENKTTTYAKAIKWCNNSYILFNDICKIDCNFELPINSFDKETGESKEFFQFYITDCSTRDKEFLENSFGLAFGYSPLLDKYILCVDHFGTSWDYVGCKVLNDNICDSIYNDISDCI